MLLRSAPHIIWPLRFVMPHDPSMRPAWMIRAGLFLYDHLARREVLPGSAQRRSARARAGPTPEAAVCRRASCIRTAGSTTPGWWCSTRSTRRRAAPASMTRTRCVIGAAQRRGLGCRRCSRAADRRCQMRARAVVNAAGPWAESFLRQQARASHGETLASRSLRLVKGSHIVVRAALRARPRLHLPEPRQADHLRDPLRGRLHADRHHRHELQGEPRRRAHRCGRDRIPVRTGQPLLQAARSVRPKWSGATPACARCSTTHRATRPP